MKNRLSATVSTAFFLGLASLSIASCDESGANSDADAHVSEVLEWRAWRLAQLKKPSGYLNQIGLFWLKPGKYSFGSAESNDVVFDADVAATIGTFTVTGDGVTMTVAEGVKVESNGIAVSEIPIPADTTDEMVEVTHRSLSWMVVERVGRYGIRLRDYEHPFVHDFGPLPYYDIKPAYSVEATLRRYPEPVVASTDTVIEGLEYRPESPGVVEFEIDDTIYTLEAYLSGDRLFYVFGDLTNRDETYGAGRFLYSTIPGADGKTTLDFNKAYSPPCAFNDFSTCPIASPRNRLPVRVEAGEKYDTKFHYSAKN